MSHANTYGGYMFTQKGDVLLNTITHHIFLESIKHTPKTIQQQLKLFIATFIFKLNEQWYIDGN